MFCLSALHHKLVASSPDNSSFAVVERARCSSERWSTRVFSWRSETEPPLHNTSQRTALRQCSCLRFLWGFPVRRAFHEQIGITQRDAIFNCLARESVSTAESGCTSAEGAPSRGRARRRRPWHRHLHVSNTATMPRCDLFETQAVEIIVKPVLYVKQGCNW